MSVLTANSNQVKVVGLIYWHTASLSIILIDS